MRRRVALAAVVTVASAGCNLSDLLASGTRGDIGALKVPLVGQVIDAEGKPAAGIAVSAFKSDEIPKGLISDGGAGLIGNSGAGLIGNAGAGLIGNTGAGFRIQAVDLQTDSSGRFVFDPGEDGNFNLEAVRNSGAKAWKLKLPLTRSGTQSIVMTLAPPGNIEGQLLPTTSATAVVWIPGSIYWTYADKEGKFKFESVPPGKFEIKAARVGSRMAGIPGESHPDPVGVQSGGITRVSLTMPTATPGPGGKLDESPTPSPSPTASSSPAPTPSPSASPSPSPTPNASPTVGFEGNWGLY